MLDMSIRNNCQPNGCYDANMPQTGQSIANQCYNVPVQNTFGPLSEWVGMSMDIDNGQRFQDQVQASAEAAQNKRRRFSTGTGINHNSFAALSIDDKLLNLFEKLNNLEQSNRTIEHLAHSVSQTSSQVNHINTRVSNHEQFLRLLAYKSIDIEARSRRRNLLFHGLAENRNENCSNLIREFLWDQMGIDADDYYIERVHRLGSLQKARQRKGDSNESIRRPIIVAFFETRNVESILESAYMLRGTKFSVTRDFPIEIVNARRSLMPELIKEKQNRNNKVSIDYPARLVVNGKTVIDKFPDWYSVLQQDRYQMANSLAQPKNTLLVESCTDQLRQTQQPQFLMPASPHPTPNPQIRYNIPDMNQINNAPANKSVNVERDQPTAARTYAEVVSTTTQQGLSATQALNVTAGATTNVPRYTSCGTGSQTCNTQAQQVQSTDRNIPVSSDRLTDLTDNAVRGQPRYEQL